MKQECSRSTTACGLPRRIHFGLLPVVKEILVPQGCTRTPPTGSSMLAEDDGDAERQDIVRWYRMWDFLFPSPKPVLDEPGWDGKGKERQFERPSPFLSAPNTSHYTSLARLEMIFAAVVENGHPPSSGSGRGTSLANGREDVMISKTNAKKHLRTAIQALVGEELDPWERVLTEPGVDIRPQPDRLSARSGSASSGRSSGNSRLAPVDADERLRLVWRGFLRLMGSR